MAGFDAKEVVGVDIEYQPRYPYKQITADVLEVLEDADWVKGFDLVHASPPCQECSWNIADTEPFLMMGGRLCWCNKDNGTVWPKVGKEGWVTVAGGTGPEYRDLGIEDRIEYDLVPDWYDRLRLGGSIVGSSDTDKRLGVLEVEDGSIEDLGRILGSDWKRGYPFGRPGYARIKVIGVEKRVGTGTFVARQALGIMRGYKAELNECVPPAYTKIIGLSFLESVDREP
jgi:hypothetical protein